MQGLAARKPWKKNVLASEEHAVIIQILTPRQCGQLQTQVIESKQQFYFIQIPSHHFNIVRIVQPASLTIPPILTNRTINCYSNSVNDNSNNRMAMLPWTDGRTQPDSVYTSITIL